MTYKEAVSIVLEELKCRLPESAKIGFMPTKEVVDAMKFIEDKLTNGKKNK
jgi:hypothetical protein